MNRTYAGVCAVHAVLIAVLTISIPAITHAAEPSQASSHPTRCESTYKKKPVPPKQLQAIVESHGQWLEHRENPEFQRADLCQADLRHAKLAGADLERARLEGTLLSQANLRESDLSQASLAGADLTRAVLKDSNLAGADLRHARLSHANLFRAIGDEAALYNAVLTGAQLRESSFRTGPF